MRRRRPAGRASSRMSWKPGRRLGIAPMSPPPCTLFWPRSGLRPAAGPPDVAAEQGEVDQRHDVVDAVVVLGDAERPAQLGPVGAGIRMGQRADVVRSDAGDALGPLQRPRLDRGGGRPRSPWWPARRSARCTRPAAMISRPTAWARAMSVPTWRPSQRSAHGAEAVRRGSTTKMRAPLRRAARTWWKKIGWVSRAFEPQSTITSAVSTSW